MAVRSSIADNVWQTNLPKAIQGVLFAALGSSSNEDASFSSLPSPLLLSFFCFFFSFLVVSAGFFVGFLGKKASILCAKVVISRLTISNLSVLLVQLSSFSYETKGIVSRVIFLLQVFSFILIKIHSRSTILHENRDHS